jgi:hypothetical protein
MQLRIDHRVEVAALLVNGAGLAPDAHGTSGSAEDIDQADLLDGEIVPPQPALLPGPRPEVQVACGVVHAVEDQVDVGREVDGLHDAAMAVLVPADVLHPQRRLAAVLHVGVHEGRDPFVVLEAPPRHVIAGELLEVAVRDPGRIVRFEDRAAVTDDEPRILDRQALHAIAVPGATHTQQARMFVGQA